MAWVATTPLVKVPVADDRLDMDHSQDQAFVMVDVVPRSGSTTKPYRNEEQSCTGGQPALKPWEWNDSSDSAREGRSRKRGRSVRLRNSDGAREGDMTSKEGNEGDSETRRRKQTQADRNRLSLRNVYSASDVDPAHIAVVLSLAHCFLLIQQCGPGPHECGLAPPSPPASPGYFSSSTTSQSFLPSCPLHVTSAS